jgi:hypothetical protein
MKKIVYALLLMSFFSVKITSAHADDWIIQGRVLDHLGQAMGGLTVSAYDKDTNKDDKLGTRITDRDGHFRIIYRTQDFNDTPNKRSPDLYLEVSDRKGKTIYSSKRRVRARAGRRENFDIRIQTEKAMKFKPKIFQPSISKPDVKIK